MYWKVLDPVCGSSAIILLTCVCSSLTRSRTRFSDAEEVLKPESLKLLKIFLGCLRFILVSKAKMLKVLVWQVNSRVTLMLHTAWGDVFFPPPSLRVLNSITVQ